MKWLILPQDKEKKLLGRLLVNRGLKTQKAREAFLNPQDPHYLTGKEVGIDSGEIKKTVARIERAVKQKEKVIIYGDYDTDGVCATAILWEVLTNKGVRVMPFLPKREEGYGLKKERIGKMAEEGVGLIVTVDQGIVQYQAAARAKKWGIDLIVTDHHLPGKKKPEAMAIIHTTSLSGAGVAWFLAKELGSTKSDHLGLAAMGTVSDLIPLLGFNRAIVKFGLREAREMQRPGLRALCKLAGIDQTKLTSYELGFMIGPRLNSSGRLTDPLDSLRLLCTKDEIRAKRLAEMIEQNNRERQTLMARVADHARAGWLKTEQKERLIFISDEAYHEGVIGLAAGKLVEEFGRPAIVLAKKGEFAKASARSIEGFNIVEALRSCADLLEAHGGHALAAGFTVKTTKLEILKSRLQLLATERLPSEKLEKVLKVETEVPFEQINQQTFADLQQLEPFGEGNRQPILATRRVEVREKRFLGADGQHLKLLLLDPISKTSVEAVGFNLAAAFSSLKVGSVVDVAYNLIMDEWNGKTKLQLKIKDIKIRD